MKIRDLMKEPFYAKIIFGIESIIHEHDEKSDGKLKDSDAKSSIRKALSILKGKPLSLSPKNASDRMKGELSLSLIGNFEWEEKKSQITRNDYMKALLAVEDTLKTRHKHAAHPRGYLDFLVGFIAQVRAQ